MKLVNFSNNITNGFSIGVTAGRVTSRCLEIDTIRFNISLGQGGYIDSCYCPHQPNDRVSEYERCSKILTSFITTHIRYPRTLAKNTTRTNNLLMLDDPAADVPIVVLLLILDHNPLSGLLFIDRVECMIICRHLCIHMFKSLELWERP